MKRFIALLPILATIAFASPAVSQAHSTPRQPVCHLVEKVKEFGQTGNYYIEESCAKRVCDLTLTPHEFGHTGYYYLEEHTVCHYKQ